MFAAFSYVFPLCCQNHTTKFFLKLVFSPFCAEKYRVVFNTCGTSVGFLNHHCWVLMSITDRCVTIRGDDHFFASPFFILILKLLKIIMMRHFWGLYQTNMSSCIQRRKRVSAHQRYIETFCRLNSVSCCDSVVSMIWLG